MYNNLRAEMARRDVTISVMAQVAGKSERSMRDKIAGRSGFTMAECFRLRDQLFPGLSMEYLFGDAGKDAG